MDLIFYFVIAFILLVVELLYFRIADRFNIIDMPNARSSHTKIVLRGGGIILLVGALLWGAIFRIQYPFFIAGLTMIAVVSFADDVRPVPNWIRLVVHFCAMFLMFYELGILQWNLWWAVLGFVILCVGIINAYNFMDGINGINGAYTFATLLPLALLNSQMHFVDQNLIIVVLLANLIFCFFNFRPKGRAKCFAGDVGSVSSAFIVIFVLGRLILVSRDFSYLVFIMVYGVDAFLTIVHRIMLHERLGEAHRKHAYQLMANELGVGHTVVASGYAALQLAISAGMICIPTSVLWHWVYLIGISGLLMLSYVFFVKKYYHLHEKYLESLETMIVEQ